MTVDERNLIIEECAAFLDGRAEVHSGDGNHYAAFEARNCAAALRRMATHPEPV